MVANTDNETRNKVAINCNSNQLRMLKIVNIYQYATSKRMRYRRF
nr:MAG TPA: hypothetical protein [Bacteriophage sp.]